MSAYQKGIEAGDLASSMMILPADLMRPTGRWQVLVGRRHTEAFLAEQPEMEWCASHHGIPDSFCDWSFRECHIVPARIVVNDTAPPAEGGEE